MELGVSLLNIIATDSCIREPLRGDFRLNTLRGGDSEEDEEGRTSRGGCIDTFCSTVLFASYFLSDLFLKSR